MYVLLAATHSHIPLPGNGSAPLDLKKTSQLYHVIEIVSSVPIANYMYVWLGYRLSKLHGIDGSGYKSGWLATYSEITSAAVIVMLLLNGVP